MLASAFVVVAGLCYCSTESSEPVLGRPQLSGPSEGLVKHIAQLKCELRSYPKNESILLKLFKKGNRNKTLGEYTLPTEGVATFNLVLRPDYAGSLECVATLQNNTKPTEATISNAHHLKVVVPVRGVAIEVLTPALEFFEGKTLTLRCTLQAGNYVSYEWFLNDQPIHQSQMRFQFSNELWINRTTSTDSGSYRCVATNQFNNTFFTDSSEVIVTVKDVVSDPDIAFVVLKEGSHNYSALVTCQSARGTAPVTFSLYNSTERQLLVNVTTEHTNATFKLPVVLGQHMGWIQCQASNGDRTAHSQWLPLEVVPVSGPVNMRYDYYTGVNYAVVHLMFYCEPAKGSHPRYRWFLNDTLLHERGSFYRIMNRPQGESELALSVDSRSAGSYHCEVSDSFDSSTGISSKKRHVDKEALNRLPVLVVAVVFGSFIFLILLVSACCWIGAMQRRRLFGDTSLLGLDMKKNIILYEGELDLLDSKVDEDLRTTTSRDDLDQASEPSVDEWQQMTEEKKTLEDGPIEFP